jgi:hypothetical protein
MALNTNMMKALFIIKGGELPQENYSFGMDVQKNLRTACCKFKPVDLETVSSAQETTPIAGNSKTVAMVATV